MRFEQIIAAVTRRLSIQGVREITIVDAFARASDLQLCMACVSPGIGMYSGPLGGHPSHPSSHAWLANDVGKAAGKRKRLPLAARLLGLAKRGSTSLAARDN